jgi:hypothetical protein
MLLPLDITTPHEIPFPLYKQVIDPTFDSPALPSKPDGKPILTHFTSSFLERTREIMLQYGKDAMELHDIVAVWCAIENPPFADDEPMSLGAGWVGTPRVFEIERCANLLHIILNYWSDTLSGLAKSLVECWWSIDDRAKKLKVLIDLKLKENPMIPLIITSQASSLLTKHQGLMCYWSCCFKECGAVPHIYAKALKCNKYVYERTQLLKSCKLDLQILVFVSYASEELYYKLKNPAICHCRIGLLSYCFGMSQHVWFASGSQHFFFESFPSTSTITFYLTQLSRSMPYFLIRC